jgi:hypothetical protein
MTSTHFRGSFFTRTLPALAMTGALALGVTACGSDDSDPVTTTAKTEKALAKVPDVTGGITRVTLDPGFVQALQSLKVTPAPIGKAKISAKGVASFPVTGGNVTYYDPKGTVKPYVQGELDHDGSGLSLTAGSKKVELEDFKIDPGTSTLTGKVSLNGAVQAPSAPLFFLNGNTLQPLRQNAQKTKAILEGTTVVLKQEAADLLNKVYGIKDLKAGMKIGIAKITVPTK